MVALQALLVVALCACRGPSPAAQRPPEPRMTTPPAAAPPTVAVSPPVVEPPPAPACGDARCEGEETCATCASDCGACSSGGSGGALGTRRGWPCTGCITSVPDAYDPAKPAPLVVSLHGDEGSPKASHGVWQRAARDNGYILLSPACPRDLGCTGRWGDGSWHRDGPAGSVAWLGAQIDAVEAAYNIDRARIYLVGGSRGAVYVGFHAHALAPRIAAAAMYAGGYSSLTSTCAACALPVYILVGERDNLLDIASKARDWFTGCGSEVVFDKLRGVAHRGAGKALLAGKADTILDWFSARPNACKPARAP